MFVCYIIHVASVESKASDIQFLLHLHKLCLEATYNFGIVAILLILWYIVLVCYGDVGFMS